MNTTPLPASSTAVDAHKRALVLGGGGSSGNAWLIGVIAGLAEAGVDATDADLVVGTSAGSTAAAQLTGAKPADLLAAILDAQPPARPAGPPAASAPGSATPGAAAPGAASPGTADPSGARPRPTSDYLAITNAIIASSADAADMRRRIGAMALDAASAGDPAAASRWRAVVAGRLPEQSWPARHLVVTAVDARTGEPAVFDPDSGVDLADAVAASCSSAVAYPIGDRRFIDGGYRRNENADLAAGFGRVLVVSPFGGRTRHPLEWRMQLAAQVDDLRTGGAAVETIFPDAASTEAFGPDMMDFSRRAPSARAGAEQGRALAGRLATFWR